MRATRRALIWAWLQTTSGRERAAVAVAALVVLSALAATLHQGRLVGANLWRPGWICGNAMPRGNPFCTRDPRGGM